MGVRARDVVLRGTPARTPFASKHPSHGCSTPVRVISCCRAVSLNKRSFRWPDEKWRWLMSTLFPGLPTVNGRLPGARTAAALMPTSPTRSDLGLLETSTSVVPTPTLRAYLSDSSRACASAALRGVGKNVLCAVSSIPSMSPTSVYTLMSGPCMSGVAARGLILASPCWAVPTGSVGSDTEGTTLTSPEAVGGKTIPVGTTPSTLRGARGGKPKFEGSVALA